MIYKLLDNGIIDKNSFFIRNYKKININDNQALIILVLFSLFKVENRVYTPNELSAILNLSEKKIEEEISGLILKNMLKIITVYNNKIKQFSFNGMFNEILKVLKKEDENEDKDLKQLYIFCKDRFNIVLNDSEKRVVEKIIENGISIKFAMESLIFSKSIKTSNDIVQTLTKILNSNKIDFLDIDWTND